MGARPGGGASWAVSGGARYGELGWGRGEPGGRRAGLEGCGSGVGSTARDYYNGAGGEDDVTPVAAEEE